MYEDLKMAHSMQSVDSNEAVVNDLSEMSLNRIPDQEDKNRLRLLQRLSLSDAFFKHQQRGEPDLTAEDKFKIAEDILSKNKILFLERFWKHLELEDISYFKQYQHDYEIDFYLNQILKSKTSNFDENQRKNRRYKAMQQLLTEGDYFSEEEMKYREPLLYEQLIGKYLTDDEINDKVDKSDLRFSNILLKHIDIIQEHAAYEHQKEEEDGQMEEEDEESEEEEEKECKMDDEEEENTDERETIPDALKATYRQEFLAIMQERFMSGQDENFNYSEVDNNTEYDDLDILQKDEEEKYFDNEDESDIECDTDFNEECYLTLRKIKSKTRNDIQNSSVLNSDVIVHNNEPSSSTDADMLNQT